MGRVPSGCCSRQHRTGGWHAGPAAAAQEVCGHHRQQQGGWSLGGPAGQLVVSCHTFSMCVCLSLFDGTCTLVCLSVCLSECLSVLAESMILPSKSCLVHMLSRQLSDFAAPLAESTWLTKRLGPGLCPGQLKIWPCRHLMPCLAWPVSKLAILCNTDCPSSGVPVSAVPEAGPHLWRGSG